MLEVHCLLAFISGKPFSECLLQKINFKWKMIVCQVAVSNSNIVRVESSVGTCFRVLLSVGCFSCGNCPENTCLGTWLMFVFNFTLLLLYC